MDTASPDLRHYLAVLWTRKWTILLIVAVSTAAAAYYSFRQTTVYTSTAKVFVRPATIDADQSPSTPGLVNMLTEEQIANSGSVARLALERLGVTDIESSDVSAAVVPDTETMTFTSTSPDPASAREIAQAFASAYLEYREARTLSDLHEARAPHEERLVSIDQELAQLGRKILKDPPDAGVLNARYAALLGERSIVVDTLDGFATPETLNVGEVIEVAVLPTSPSAPSPTKDLAVGFLVGLAIGIAGAFARERLDNRLRDRRELELQSGAPVLAFVPRIHQKQPPPITVSQPTSEAAESYKALRVRLLHAAREQQLRTVLVTSSLAGEGKTSTTANLGVALAIDGKRAVMVSADLRRPALHNYFAGVADGPVVGLAGVLAGSHRAFDMLRPTGIDNLWLMGFGTPEESIGPLELLGSDAMRDLVSELRQSADLVLIDTPPVLTSPDVAAVAPVADGVLFVVDPRRADREIVEQARYELRLMDVPVIGVVVSRFTPRTFRAYGGGYGPGYSFYRYSTDGAGHAFGDQPSQGSRSSQGMDQRGTR